MKISKQDIVEMETRKRAFFINSLSGFKSANLVGTANVDGKTNLAIVSSVIHLGSNPALLAMVIRPDTVPRGTLENILATGFYTLNHVNEDIYKQAHQTSARYPDSVSEFEKVGLGEECDDAIPAPFVKESRIKLGMKFREHHPLEINGTIFVIGEVISVEIPNEAIAEDGFVSLEAAGTLTISSLDTYHKTEKLESLSYAKPNVDLTTLNHK